MSTEIEKENEDSKDSIHITPLIEKSETTHNEFNTSDKTIESIKSNSIIMNRKVRWSIFFLFIILNLLMNFDHGTIPAATEQLRNYLNLNDSELGLFGSLVFLGVIIGSLITLSIINTFNRKYILMIFLILCGFSLFLFTKTKEYVLLCIDRVIIGIFQAFVSIYLPLWCDQFGVENRKTLMLASIQVVGPLGVLVGYVVTTLLNMYLSWLPYFGNIDNDERWLFSFYIQSILIWGLSFCLLFFSDKYFNSKARRVPIEIEETLNILAKNKNPNVLKLSFFYDGNQSFQESKDDNNSENKFVNEENENIDIKNRNIKNETIKEVENDLNIKETNYSTEDKSNIIDKNKSIENNNDMIKREERNNSSYENEKNEENLKSSKKDITFCKKVKLIFSEPLFIFCVLTMSMLYFIVTCVQYWASDYMLVALEITDETKRLFSFSIVCLTSPTFGLLMGGFIVDKLGGYSKKSSLGYCLIFSILSIIPAIPLPLVDSLYLYAGLLWILLFLGASLIPPTQGIIIACLPKDVQGSGNSFSIFFFNLLGYFPAPFVYGFLKDYFNEENDVKRGSRFAQKITMWSTTGVFITVGISCIIRFIKDDEYNLKMGRDKAKINNIKNKNDEDAIRPRESSLAFNTKQHIKISDKVFNNENNNENYIEENDNEENYKEKNNNNIEMNIENKNKEDLNIKDENI